MRTGPPNARAASAKLIPCFRILSRFFCSSHTNRRRRRGEPGPLTLTPAPHRVCAPLRLAARKFLEQGAVVAVGGLLALAVPLQPQLDQAVHQLREWHPA